MPIRVPTSHYTYLSLSNSYKSQIYKKNWSEKALTTPHRKIQTTERQRIKIVEGIISKLKMGESPTYVE